MSVLLFIMALADFAKGQSSIALVRLGVAIFLTIAAIFNKMMSEKKSLSNISKTSKNGQICKQNVLDYGNLKAGELYDVAYRAYESKDYDETKAIYNVLLEKFPNSKEAKWAKKFFKIPNK